MTEFYLQAATAAQETAVKNLVRAVQINPLGLDWRRFLVAVDDTGALIGCGQAKPHGDGARELASIAVVRPWRRQGIARAIIQRLQADHAPPLWLTCVSSLVPFYAQFGFREVMETAVMPPYFRRVCRLFSLYTRFSSQSDYLAVMVWVNADERH